MNFGRWLGEKALTTSPTRLRRPTCDLLAALLRKLRGTRCATLKSAEPPERYSGRILPLSGSLPYNVGVKNIYVARGVLA